MGILPEQKYFLKKNPKTEVSLAKKYMYVILFKSREELIQPIRHQGNVLPQRHMSVRLEQLIQAKKRKVTRPVTQSVALGPSSDEEELTPSPSPCSAPALVLRSHRHAAIFHGCSRSDVNQPCC